MENESVGGIIVDHEHGEVAHIAHWCGRHCGLRCVTDLQADGAATRAATATLTLAPPRSRGGPPATRLIVWRWLTPSLCHHTCGSSSHLPAQTVRGSSAVCPGRCQCQCRALQSTGLWSPDPS